MANILVVEDEQPLARALELKLQNSGFDVSLAYNGSEAMNVMGEKKFDLVLLDLVMPEKDGFTVLSEMKEKKFTMPVMVLTNLGQEDDVNRAKALGAKDYFVKSQVSIAEIVERVKSALQ